MRKSSKVVLLGCLISIILLSSILAFCIVRGKRMAANFNELDDRFTRQELITKEQVIRLLGEPKDNKPGQWGERWHYEIVPNPLVPMDTFYVDVDIDSSGTVANLNGYD
jgi:hypothetical protein